VLLVTTASSAFAATGQDDGPRTVTGQPVGQKGPLNSAPPTTQPAGKRAPNRQTGPAKAAPAKKKPGCGDATPAEVKAAERSTRARTGGDATGADSNEGPRFAVDKEMDQAESIWMGTSAKFAFTIRNEGTADLNIKAKGG